MACGMFSKKKNTSSLSFLEQNAKVNPKCLHVIPVDVQFAIYVCPLTPYVSLRYLLGISPSTLEGNNFVPMNYI